jgi:hypothetical protein
MSSPRNTRCRDDPQAVANEAEPAGDMIVKPRTVRWGAACRNPDRRYE